MSIYTKLHPVVTWKKEKNSSERYKKTLVFCFCFFFDFYSFVFLESFNMRMLSFITCE